MSLWIAIALMTLVTVAAMAAPLIRSAKLRQDNHDQAVYQDQLLEIDRDMERGVLNQVEAEALKTEIARRMIKSGEQAVGGDDEAPASGRSQIIPAVALIIIVPLAALGLYRHLGSPDDRDLPFAERTITPPQTQNQAKAAADMDALVDGLKRRMEQNPERLDGWLLLGRSLMSLRRFDEAVEVFSRADSLANEPKLVRADVTVSLAEAAYMAAGGQFTPKIRKLLQAGRAAAPREPKTLFYIGLDLARQNKFAEAVQIWTDLLAITPVNAPWRSNITEQIATAAQAGNIDAASIKSRLAPLKQVTPPAPSAPAAQKAAPGPTQEDVKAAGEMSSENRQAFIRSMVERLAERLKESPDDLDGWRRLARAYQVLGDTAKAAEAAKQIRRLEEK